MAAPAFRLQPVGQRHEAKQRLQTVVSVCFARQNSEEEIDLGVRIDADTRGSVGHSAGAPRRSRNASGVRTSDQTPSRLIGMNVVT